MSHPLAATGLCVPSDFMSPGDFDAGVLGDEAVGGDEGQPVGGGRGDEQAVAGVAVDRRQGDGAAEDGGIGADLNEAAGVEQHHR